MIYVMSDIHGHTLEFIEMLEKIRFSGEDTLYILGDVIDRGECNIPLLKFIMDSENIILLKGNHEAMMLDYLQGKDKCGDWFANGGDITFHEYKGLKKKDQTKIYNFLYSLPLYKEIDVNGKHYFLSHAGMIINPKFDLEKLIELNSHQPDNFYWLRRAAFFMDVDVSYLNTTFIFGHTPVCILEDYAVIDEENTKRIRNNMIYKTEYKINIDTGVAFNKQLSCLRLDDMEEFYIDIK